MSPCTSDTITPKMIKSGHMKIGDRIYIEESHSGERLVSAPERENPTTYSPKTSAETMPEKAQVAEASAPVSSAAMPETPPVASPTVSAASVAVAAQSQAGLWQSQPAQPGSRPQPQGWNQSWNGNMQMNHPLGFEEMTPYLDNITITGETPSPTVSLPQSPMTTSEFTETIGLTDVQAYTGFLRTQIGRFMRVEQLIGSNVIEDRYGYLVGVGTNFIVLQEMFTGNIMIIDLFSIKLTYIYFTDAPSMPVNR